MVTSTKIILETTTIPRVEIDFMNNTHFEEVEMVKLLGELISDHREDNNNLEKITQSLQSWLQHTQTHFSRENALMLEIQFPVYSVHSGEHEKALIEMTNRIKAWETSHDIEMIADYVFSLWPTWFEQHVNSMDMMTAKIAVMHGYDSHIQKDKNEHKQNRHSLLSGSE